jgi:hypothetical protein
MYSLNCRSGGLSSFWCLTISVIMLLGCDTNRKVPKVNLPVDFASLVGVSEAPSPNEVLFEWWHYAPREDSMSFDRALSEAINTEVLDISMFALDDKALANIRIQCPNLKWLRIWGDPVDKEVLDWVAEFVELRGLSLKSSNLGENDLYFLKDLPKLEWLDLRVLRLPPAEHFRIDSLQQLEALFLDVRGVTDDHLNNLQGMPNLKVLSLDHTSVSDNGVALVANKFPHLRYLSLFCVKDLTSNSMHNLARMKELKYLYVGLTQMERQLYVRDYDGLPDLQRLLPECFIGIGD